MKLFKKEEKVQVEIPEVTITEGFSFVSVRCGNYTDGVHVLHRNFKGRLKRAIKRVQRSYKRDALRELRAAKAKSEARQYAESLPDAKFVERPVLIVEDPLLGVIEGMTDESARKAAETIRGEALEKAHESEVAADKAVKRAEETKRAVQ